MIKTFMAAHFVKVGQAEIIWCCFFFGGERYEGCVFGSDRESNWYCIEKGVEDALVSAVRNYTRAREGNAEGPLFAKMMNWV